MIFSAVCGTRRHDGSPSLSHPAVKGRPGPGDFALGDFLSGTLLLVMGIEFVKMLALHTADAVVDVLLFTIVRQMIVNHTDAVETLLGVAAVAGIFAIKKFLQTREDTE